MRPAGADPHRHRGAHRLRARPLVDSLARHGVPRWIGAALGDRAPVRRLATAATSSRRRSCRSSTTCRRRRGAAGTRQDSRPPGRLRVREDAAGRHRDRQGRGGGLRARRRRRPACTRVQVVEPAFRATDYLWAGGRNVVAFLGQFAMVLFLVFFLLVTGDLFKRKLVKIAGPTLTKKKVTVQIMDDINQQISGFLRVQVLTSALVAGGDRARAVVLRRAPVRRSGAPRRDLQFDSLPRSPGRDRRSRRRRVHAVRRPAEDTATSAGSRSPSPASKAGC